MNKFQKFHGAAALHQRRLHNPQQLRAEPAFLIAAQQVERLVQMFRQIRIEAGQRRICETPHHSVAD